MANPGGPPANIGGFCGGIGAALGGDGGRLEGRLPTPPRTPYWEEAEGGVAPRSSRYDSKCYKGQIKF